MSMPGFVLIKRPSASPRGCEEDCTPSRLYDVSPRVAAKIDRSKLWPVSYAGNDHWMIGPKLDGALRLVYDNFPSERSPPSPCVQRNQLVATEEQGKNNAMLADQM